MLINEWNMFDAILAPANIELAYKKTQLGSPKYKVSAINFARDRIANLSKLLVTVWDGSYQPLPYVEFVVFEPKERIIHAPRYPDKIVQHMVNNVLAPFFARRFIFDSYACIQRKGNQRAVKRIQYGLRQSLQQYGTGAYVVKIDISKFFYSIDRECLKAIIAKYIHCYATQDLLFTIIDSSPGNVGLPLGNLTSQLLANVYMNELDQYCKRQLRCRHYIRYADDIFVVCTDKASALLILDKIRCFCETQLRLTAHPYKSGIQPITQPLAALGFKISPKRITLKRSTKVRIEKQLRRIQGNQYSDIELIQLEQQINGWLNFASLANIDKQIELLVQKFPFLSYQSNQLKLAKTT